MAALAGMTATSLHELLRRSTGLKVANTNDQSVASCMDAFLPLYSFPAHPAAEPPCKLSRKDSFPTVPDDYDEPRCDSPAAELPSYIHGADSGSFNSLPLSIDVQPFGLVPSHLLQSANGSGAADVSGFLVKKSSEFCAMPRAQPRRNASDVELASAAHFNWRGDATASHAAVVPSRSLLEAALMTLWEDRADRGLFRYNVSQCPSRVLPGAMGFIAQLNEGRATKKRPTEFSMDRVMQPFDPSKFNFRKASMTEALVAFQPFNNRESLAFAAPQIVPPSAPLAQAAADGCSPNLVLINVSPIDHGHVLLVPRVLDCLPQSLDASTVLLALQFAHQLGSAHFRVGYNSLGAFATINHLHFHSYYLPLALPCESAATVPLLGALGSPATVSVAAPSRKRRAGATAGVLVSRLVGYPVNGFVVEPDSSAGWAGDSDAASLEAVAWVVATAAERMQAVNQPFNLLVSDAGSRVFIFPQCYAERQAAGVVPQELLDTGVNPASFEIAGHLVLKRAEDYAAASQGWAARLLAEVSLDEERFMRVAEMCFGEVGAGVAVE